MNKDKKYSKDKEIKKWNIYMTLFMILFAVGVLFFVIIDNKLYLCGNINDELLYELNADGNSYSVTLPDSMRLNVQIFKANVNIPGEYNGKPVTSIARYAFRGCDRLMSITIPDSVTYIEEGAFSGCSGLTGITIPDGVRSIGYAAFYGCSGLTSITIPYSMSNISDSAFENCSELKSVIWNAEYCVKLDSDSRFHQVFKGCSKLTDVIIGEEVKTIPKETFSNCSGLVNIYTNNLAAWCEISGLSNLMCYGTDNKKLYLNGVFVTDIEIPDSVTRIEDYAFYNCSGITSVTIPDKVTSIGESAFENCSGLTSVIIGNSVTEIGGWSTFYGCRKLVEVIDNSNLDIKKRSEENGYIGYYALNVKKGETTDIVRKNDYLFYTYKGANYLLGYVGNSTKLILPNDYNGQSYNIYKTAFFKTRNKLTSVAIPDSVTGIGGSAFEECDGLTSITIPASVTEISWLAFKGCSNLKNINIPDSVKSIGSSAFSGCSGLTSITLPDSVTSIEHEVFSDCSGLTSITLPDSIKSIGYAAFSGCSGLMSITIPDSVTSIERSVFSYCSGLTSIKIPDSVTSIGWHAFYSCSGLTSIIIPDSVTCIEEGAFSNCSGLTSVIIGKNVSKICGWVFSGCSSLKIVEFKDAATWYKTSSFDDMINKNNGELVDVSDSANNASIINDYYWYKL